MELKVGDYVRTLDGISKVIECRDNRFVNEDGNVYFYNDMMCNPSPNIKDLIEVGDYVNGFLVNFVGNDGIEVFWYKDETQWLEQDDIKSIVTKEQFEQMEYRIGEDE